MLLRKLPRSCFFSRCWRAGCCVRRPAAPVAAETVKVQAPTGGAQDYDELRRSARSRTRRPPTSRAATSLVVGISGGALIVLLLLLLILA